MPWVARVHLLANVSPPCSGAPSGQGRRPPRRCRRWRGRGPRKSRRRSTAWTLAVGGEALHSLLVLAPIDLLVAGGELGPWPADLIVPHPAPLALLDQMLDLIPVLGGVVLLPHPVADVLSHRRKHPALALQVVLQPLPPRGVVGQGGAEAEVGVLFGCSWRPRWGWRGG